MIAACGSSRTVAAWGFKAERRWRNPHPDPLPEYMEREKKRGNPNILRKLPEDMDRGGGGDNCGNSVGQLLPNLRADWGV
jgi:hypothetical protein